ncbi:MAG: imidazolonepropionase-like amidohydrolase [Phycisphaerales bacterium]|jgi:imidazolonepropionase-like amidohydrolase
MHTKTASVVALAAACLTAIAQPSSSSPFSPPANGPRSAEPTAYAITNATVHTAPGEVSLATTVLIDRGHIVRVASEEEAAAISLDGYRVIDGEGLHVYPGFIDAWVQVPTPDVDQGSPGRHPSNLVQPERDVLSGPGLTADQATGLRKLGFGAAAITPEDGIFRGLGAVVSTAAPYANPSDGRVPVYAGAVMDVMGFATARGSGADQISGYPNSTMGIMSLTRQTYLDAAFWRESGPHGSPTTLDAVSPGQRPTFWNSSSTLQSMLADKVFGEFGFEGLVVVGGGDEYQRLDAMTGAGHAMVVPLRFPSKPDLSSVGQVDGVSLEQLQAWEQAPANPRLLHDAGLTVAITSAKLPDGADFHANLRRAINEGGLSTDDALAMLTTVPAELLGVSDTLGTIEPGKAANLVVTDDELFNKKTKIRSVWVDGRESKLDKPDEFPLDGDWQLRLGDQLVPIGFTFKGKAISGWEDTDSDDEAADAGGADEADEADEAGEAGEVKRETTKGRSASVDKGSFSLLLDDKDSDATYVISGSLQASGEIAGSFIGPDGEIQQYTAIKVETPEKADADAADVGEEADAEADDDADENGADDEEAKDDDEPAESELIPPMTAQGFGPYARADSPAQEPVLFTGATVWTSGPDGTIENGYVYMSGGKVIAVGKANPDGTINYQVPDTVRRVDATGLHITPGLIDTHSHSGLFRLGVNESGQAVTAECRIDDSLDPTNITWYRQIATGVTTAQLLHGSANAIGGQSQIVKNRWGAQRPQDLFMQGAMPGIKFALGENPRGVNWNANGSGYPQTRMGVEALIRDRLTAGKAYAENGMRTPDGRIDLELQAIAEIIKGERLIHCHSYRQDEILMLCDLADEFGITIGTFQHGLEVYKVAEAVQKHAIGASIFSDWWAYKLEVQDAIAQGGPVASEAGVLMSYNSDSDDLARRLNLEAAKAVKYSQGRISQEEALKFVTINPAIQLGMGHRIGSIEPGKDADLAIWNGNPLSTFSKCEATFVDGREYFSTDRDLAHRAHIKAERMRLIAKINKAPDRGEDKADKADDDKPGEGRGRGAGRRPDGLDHAGYAEADHLTSGSMEPGDCGCITPPMPIVEIR